MWRRSYWSTSIDSKAVSNPSLRCDAWICEPSCAVILRFRRRMTVLRDVVAGKRVSVMQRAWRPGMPRRILASTKEF